MGLSYPPIENRYTTRGIKRPEHEADFSPTSKVEFKNQWDLGG
jgi:hypothetical protein